MKQSLLYFFGILYIVCLWTIISVNTSPVDVVTGQTSSEDCPYQALPNSLNDMNFLDFNGEFHIHETYYYDFSTFQKKITFTLEQDSSFRIYVAPHVVDIDLWLYDTQATKSINHTSDATVGGDENLYADLKAGSYELKFLFFGQNKGKKLACPTIELEIAVTPTSVMQNRLNNYKICPSQSTLPVFQVDATKLPYVYDSDINDTKVMSVVDQYSTSEISIITSYTIDLPDAQSKYSVDVSLGFDFLTGGSLNVLIQEASLSDPVDKLPCINANNCTIGVHTAKSHSNIRTILYPGSYKLFIYDQTHEKDYSISPSCNQFSLYVKVDMAQQIEDFLNCPEYELPKSFNEPGYLNDGGYLYFDEDILIDLSVTHEDIPFTITENSYFRAYIPDYRIDIDIRLTSIGATSNTTIASSFKFGGEEEITANIKPGNYLFQLFYFGKKADVFCDTYALEVQIQPISDFVSSCSGSKNIDPPINQINNTLNTEGSYYLNYADSTGVVPDLYQFVPSTDQKAQNITYTTFTVPAGKVYLFESIVESSFATADIRLVIVDLAMQSDQSDILYVGTHDRNRHSISLVLYPGDFSIQVQTGSTSKHSGSDLPNCLAYSLAIRITEQDKSRPSCDMISKELPTTLNSPAYLLSSQHVQLAGEFYFPPSDFVLYSNDEISFKPSVDSIFRAYTQYNSIDIDMTLYEGTTPVAWTSKFYEEEALVYTLKANTQYKLRLKYIHIGSVSSCIPYYFGLTISPKSDNPVDTCSNTDNVPTNGWIKDASNSAFYVKDNFFFRQKNVAADIQVSFNIPASVGNSVFRAILSSDFIWNNLAFELKSVDNDSPLSNGELTYNRLEIETLELVPGTYILHIYEPFSNNIEQLELRNCVEFSLEVGLQSKLANSVNDAIVCPAVELPNTFNSIGYMSALSSNSLYYAEKVLARVQDARDTVTFTIAQKSMLRIYIPYNADMNINVQVLNINGGIIANSMAQGEDIIYVEITPQQYQIVFTYFGLGGALPRVDDCPSFYAFISIVATSDLLNIPSITSDCSSASINNLPSNFSQASFSQTYSRSLLVKPTTKVIPIENQQWAHLYVNLDYNDLVSSLAMKVEGSYVSSNGITIHQTYFPLYQSGEAFLNEILPPGSWKLSIYDPYTSTSPDSSIQCAPFTFSYAVNYSSNGHPTDSCEELAALPASLSDIQSFSARKLLMKKSSIVIPISVPSKTTYIRIFSKSDPGSQALFNIYKSDADRISGKDPIFSTMSSVITDSNIWQLDAQTNNYSLVVGFNPNKNADCSYYGLEVALDHFDNIQKSLLCPAKKPNEVDQVPAETVSLQVGVDYFINKDYFFDSIRINNNVQNGVFRYRITITAVEPVIIDAEVNFDFLSNDFNLVFGKKNADRSDRKLATGVDFIGSDSDITNKITYNIDSAGTYYLDITENMKYNNFSVANSCHFFGFSLSSIAVNSTLAPRIFVSPDNKVNISPDKPLVITLTFSEAVNITLGSTTLLNYITLNNIVKLNTPSHGIIQPTTATLLAKNTQLKLSFTGLKSVTSYTLGIDTTQFISTSGRSYAPLNSTNTYTTFGCECNNRGTCDNPTDNGCNCQAPWAGTDCSKCMVGYHGEGDSCVPNADCTSNTCNGHGTCTNPTGVPQCSCKLGYNSPNSTALCGDCAFGYQGYPNCKLIPDQEDTYCYAPILPRNLTHIQYLGFNGKVHLQDNYYIDMASGSHDTFITIKAESLLRVYTEPHHVDVDLWLYSVTQDDELINIVDRSITFNREEVLLVVLQPGFYRLSFKYFNWNKVVTSNCETFNLELAIDDTKSIQEDTETMNQVYTCTNTPSLQDNNPFIPKVISKDQTNSDYSKVYKLEASPSNQVTYLYNTTFTIAPSQEGYNFLADIELSYQFLIGDISMVIVSGNNTDVIPSCKGSTDTSVSGCIFGDNELNRNVIQATLYPGDYVLYIYAPEYTNITGLSCVLFNMRSQFTLIKDDEDYFNCLGEPIPITLNTPEFLGFKNSTDNYLHLQDFYLMDKKAATIKFETTAQTLIRIHAQQVSAVNTLTLLNLATNDVYNKYSDTIYMNIAAGAYQLTITSNRITSSKNFCPLVNLEIAIEPSNIPLLLDDDCPVNNKPSVPSFSAQVPFIFENGTTQKRIYTVPINSDETVAMYSFTLGQTCQFYTAVASEFLRGNLRVNLYTKLEDSTLMLTTKGTHDYNYNWLQQNLEPGQYVLKIERPQYDVSNTNQPKCIPFEFEFSLLPLSKVPMCPGEPIPLDFNSVRFLGSEGRMHYQSDNLVIPPSNLIYTNYLIPIRVTKKSVLRLYVNPHIVDIDIKLLDATNKNETIISGSNLLNTEEAFITVLDKLSNTGDDAPKYFIQLQFWRWSSSIPACNTFSLEIAVAPVDEINVTASCPAGTTNSLFPVIQTTFEQGASYNYSNVFSDTPLYFQQSTAGPVSKSYSITTKGASNIHIQAGYKFLTGDLAIKLVSTTKTKKTYYGVSAPNRNILEVVNLPAGTYTLTISEPYTSLKDIVGCSYFNFEFFMEPYTNLDQEDGFYHYLPETLNTYAYLSYNNHVHLQGEYIMYDGIPLHNQVEFVLFNQSLIRVQASILPDNEVNTFNETNIPTVYVTDGSGARIGTVGYGSYVNVLEAGDYILHFGNTFFSVSNVPVDVEIAIALVTQVEKYISNIPYPSNCTFDSSSIQIVPSKEDGTFYYHEMLTIPASKMSNNTIILMNPFTINVPSKVYIQIGYQFLLGDLNVQITNDDVSLNFIGKANRNSNEINAELPPGEYNLVITSIGGNPSIISEHCTPFYLAIIIRDISSDIHADCSIYNAIPWDLNRKDGGSAPFGGPIDSDGYLRIYSDDFIAPSNTAQRNISFSVSQDTLINIFTIDNLAASIDVDVFTQDTNIDQDLIFYTSLHSSAQRSSVYLASASSRTSFDISLDFSGISKGSCPAFGLQIVTKPASYLTEQLLCPANYAAKLPNSSPKVDSDGTYIEYLSSHFTGDYISKHQVKTNFEYYIDFNITKTSRIDASFSFDSIASNFYLKLATRSGNTRSVIGTGDWTAELSYGETSMTSTITTGSLRAGQYSLIISHPPAINPIVQSSSIYNDLCLPFSYSLTIMDNSKVYVGSFTPSNGHNIDPTRDLVLFFSSDNKHYNVSGSQIVCDDNSTIASSFYLASQTSSDSVYPSSVLCLKEDGTSWQMTFSNLDIDRDTTYVLSLVPNQIFDSNGVQSTLPPQNIYNFMDTSCSNNGGYQNGRCVCATGYSGIDCGVCSTGYHNINTGSGSPTCVSKTCNVKSCNCDPNISGTCIALGTCMVNEQDDIYCICSKQYNGTTCNQCSNGYVNWPYCEPHFECGPCGKGSCDYSVGICSCPSNFQGPNCNECAEGYHGKDCAKNGSGAIIALEVIATLIAVSIVIGVGIWYVRTRYRSGVARYKMLPKFEFDDDRTTKFPGLYDEDEDDLEFNNDKKDTSINRGSGKTHVFSFSSMPVSALDSDDSDEERLTATNNAKNQSNKHLFDM